MKKRKCLVMLIILLAILIFAFFPRRLDSYLTKNYPEAIELTSYSKPIFVTEQEDIETLYELLGDYATCSLAMPRIYKDGPITFDIRVDGKTKLMISPDLVTQNGWILRNVKDEEEFYSKYLEFLTEMKEKYGEK